MTLGDRIDRAVLWRFEAQEAVLHIRHDPALVDDADRDALLDVILPRRWLRAGRALEKLLARRMGT